MKKESTTIGILSILISLVLVGCGQSNKLKTVHHSATPLTVNDNKYNKDDDVQGLRLTAFDSNNESKDDIKTASDAKVFIKDYSGKDKYNYKINKIGTGHYQIVYKNSGLRNEAHSGAISNITASSPSYTKESQIGLLLHTDTGAIMQSIVNNVKYELKSSNDIDAKGNVQLKGEKDNQFLNVIIDSDTTPTPPTDTVVSALKGVNKSDISSFKNIKISINTDGKNYYWYDFLPYDIKTMPLNNMDTNDLNYIAFDKGSSSEY